MTNRSYHHGDLRAQLIATVTQLVEERGADGFSITEASRRAGVSSAAPYKHFRDKPEIMRAVTAAAMERLADRMEEGAAAHPRGSLGRVSAIGRAYIAFALAEPGLFKVMFGSEAGAVEDPDLHALGLRTFGIVLDAVAARRGAAPDAPEVRLRAYTLWTIVHGHSFLAINENTPADGERPDEETFLANAARQVVDG